MVLRKKGIPWIYDGVPFSFFMVYVMNEIQLQVALMARKHNFDFGSKSSLCMD
jgi:hypothetical protein